MAYAEAHNYLTVHWTVPVTSEQGQFGLRFQSAATPGQADVDGAAAAVSAYWTAATSLVSNQFTLDYLRVARIGTDGKYLPGSQSFDHVFAPPLAGGAANGNFLPMQCAIVATLLTATPRGLAHAGRIYCPPLQTALGSDRRWTSAQVSSMINTLAQMLSTLSGSSLGNLAVFSKGNATTPVGPVHPVTGVLADLAPDVQRRRAKSMARIVSITGTVS